jgi:hypothetical protein
VRRFRRGVDARRQRSSAAGPGEVHFTQ